MFAIIRGHDGRSPETSVLTEAALGSGWWPRHRRCGATWVVSVGLILASAIPCYAQEGETLYLSGTGHDDTREWEFFSTGGRRSGVWTTIPVPSQWELEGFGSYNYGREEDKSDEQGRYRTRFVVPPNWQDRHIELVFGGVMTDAQVWLNGRSAGPEHRGGFFRFSYDVTELLHIGEENQLEVLVSKQSADESVNRAERDADYWVFGGIYRSVYLEASPAAAITHVAIDARHDGNLSVDVEIRSAGQSSRLAGRVVDGDGRVASTLTANRIGKSGRLRTRVDRPRTWSAESPTLYTLLLELLDDDGERVVHRVRRRFGFRTIELRPGRGLFVNDRRVLLKGINRQAFWPSSGRTMSRDLDYADVALIKELNANAVRSSHYPPDETFLEACDEIGLYVIDELPGWHDAYDTGIGRGLVREMVRRDVNHPSVILWANGNEGGWNVDLDKAFGQHDPQERPVIHPGDSFGGIDASHYSTWSELERGLEEKWRFVDALRPKQLVLPTEFLHGLYDGGGGAGLEGYWSLIRASARALGGFLWAFVDEGVERTDHDGCLDTHGNFGPDGVFGPHRERERSFDAIRRTWSPVHVSPADLKHGFDGRIELENRFDMTDLSECRFQWQWLRFPRPGVWQPPDVVASGDASGPSVAPGNRGELHVGLPPPGRGVDALRLTVVDPHGREVEAHVLPLRSVSRHPSLAQGGEPATVRRHEGSLVLAAAGTEVRLDAESGELLGLRRDEQPFSLSHGPRRASGVRQSVAELRNYADGGSQVVEVRYAKGMEFVVWRLEPSGWLRLRYQLRLDSPAELFGVGFSYPEEMVEGFVWLGSGPGRVWKNRQAGGVVDLWWTSHNDTVTGVEWNYPEFKGHYAQVRWGDLLSLEGRLTMVLEADDLYVGLFSARSPEGSDRRGRPLARHTAAVAPVTDISLLNGIPAIGTKFHPAEDLAPPGSLRPPAGLYRGAASFFLHPRDPEAGSVARPVPLPRRGDTGFVSEARACPPDDG